MSWWEPFELADEQERSIELGPLSLLVARSGSLVRVAHRSVGDERFDVSVGGALPVDAVSEEWKVERFAGIPPATLIRLRPLTAPRAVVTRPEVPLVVAAGTRLEVYVSTPILVAVEVGAALMELPVRVPKPTFFGGPTRGTLAYAMRTLMRVDFANVEARPHRAITPVQIANLGHDPLRVERLRIPVTRLTVHADPQGLLWTGTIVLQRHEGQEEAEVQVGKPGPGPALGPPREATPVGHPVLHVFNSVFS